MYDATSAAALNSTSPTNLCPDFLVESMALRQQWRITIQLHKLTGNVVDANVNNDSTGFYPRALYKLCFANCRHKDISSFDLSNALMDGMDKECRDYYIFLDIFCETVALSNRRIASSQH